MGTKVVHLGEESRVFRQVVLSSLGKGSESEKRPQQKICYRAEYDTGVLNLEELRKR